MAVIKYHNGTDWVIFDAKNLDSVDGLSFRVSAGKLQYSIDGSNWVNAT